MDRWYQAAEKRCSIRSYMGAPSQSEIDSLRQFADSIALDDVRIAIAKQKVFTGRLMTPKSKALTALPPSYQKRAFNKCWLYGRAINT